MTSRGVSTSGNQLTRVAVIALVVILVSVLSVTMGARAADAAPDEITVGGVTAYSLGNGMRVLLCPDPGSARVTVVTTYRVGSRHEGPGQAGMAHMLEHMLTKGTRDFESIWDTLADRGADFNATTWFDRTNFFETLPAGAANLDLALHIEAERMTTAVLDSSDLANEMEVIANEFEYVESEPALVLSLQTMAAAYHWHPYGRPTIGNLEDIRRYPIEDLRAFYRAYYRPDRATLFIGGRFDAARARETIAARFAPIPPSGGPAPAASTVEPDQEGPRLVTVRRRGGVPRATLLYRTPAGSHPDAPVLQVLLELLVAKPSGRLWTELVDGGRAAEVSAGESDALVLAEPGVLEIMVTAGPGQDALELMERAAAIAEGFAVDPPTDRAVELARARLAKRLQDDEADLAAFGPALSEWIALGDWRTYFVHIAALEGVQVDDVCRVAAKYLVADNRTAGLYVPTESPMRAAIPAAPSLEKRMETVIGTETTSGTGAEVTARTRTSTEPGPATPTTRPEDVRPVTLATLDERTLKLSLDPGVQVGLLVKPTRSERVVAAFRVHYGTEERLRGKRAACRLLPDLLLKGTEDLDARSLHEELDLLRSEIEIRGHEGVLGIIVRSDREHLAPTIDLLGEVLRRPAFEQGSFAALQAERTAQLEAGRSSPVECAFDALRRATHDWPESSFHYIPTPEEEIAALRDLTAADVRSLHGELLGAGATEVAIVGEFDPGRAMRAVGEALGGWAARVAYERVDTPVRAVTASELVLRIPDQRMAVVAAATTLPLRDDDPDFPPLRLASWALVEKSKAILAQRLRHDEGLSYHVSGALRADERDDRASLYAYAFCSPGNAERAQAVLREEIDGWIRGGLDEETLAVAKQSWLGQLELDLADDEFVARRILDVLELGRPAMFEAERTAGTSALTTEDVRSALRRQLGEAAFFQVRAGDFAERSHP